MKHSKISTHLFYLKHLAMLFRIVLLSEHTRELTNRSRSTDFVCKLGNQQDMEVLEEVENLVDILVLHLSTSNALSTSAFLIREHHLRHERMGVDCERMTYLVNHHRVHGNTILGKLLDKTLGFIYAQELRNAHTNKGGFLRILKAERDLVNGLLHVGQLLLHIFKANTAVSEERHHLVHDSSKTIANAVNLLERGLQHVGEGEKSKGVTGGGCVKHHSIILHILYLIHQLTERHCLVNSGDGRGEIAQQIIDLASCLFAQTRNREQVLHC